MPLHFFLLETGVKTMTEEQIERKVERLIDHLDRVFLAGGMTQDNYDKAIRDIRDWAETKSSEARERRWARKHGWGGES